MISRYLVSLTVVAGMVGCSTTRVPRQPCDAEHPCSSSHICSNAGVCVPFFAPDCAAGASFCPSLAEGQPCARAGAVMPCADESLARACDGGCHVCEGGAWSSCRRELCNLGLLHSCASCEDDCTRVIIGKSSQCLPKRDGDGFGCVAFGNCQPGFIDANGEAADGCECEYTGREVCDGRDNDCDGEADEGEDLDGCELVYRDLDGDGYGDPADARCLCGAPYGYAARAGDCDDDQAWCGAACHEGAREVCDGFDNDCNNAVDEGDNLPGCRSFYIDQDGDGVGVGEPMCQCSPASFYRAEVDGDCDESDPLTYPLATEICDGLDNDCDGEVDEGAAPSSCRDFYKDQDGDGFGAGEPSCQCGAGDGYVRLNGLDCNDNDSHVYPGAPELCDGNSNNCASTNPGWPAVPANETDSDGDGFVACVSWNDIQGDNPSILGGGDCEPTNASVRPGTTPGCTLADGWVCTAGAPACTPRCGDGRRVGAEDDGHVTRCDDGNTRAGDGCSGTCTIESGYICTELAARGTSYCRKSCQGFADVNFSSTTLPMLATRVVGANAAGALTLAVSDSSEFAAGDLVLIVTMQADDDECTTASSAGRFELNDVMAVGTGVLTLRWPLSRAYDAEEPDTPPHHQVVKVPSYRDVTVSSSATLTAAPWDPATKTGGVLALRAEKLTLNSSAKIDMARRGFRGGAVATPFSVGPEGPFDAQVAGQPGRGGGDGGSGAYTSSTSGQPGTYVDPEYYGGGGGSRNYSASASGACGGGGGGSQGGSGGSGSGKGGAGYSGLSSIAAGGGGCPFAAAVCEDRTGALRFLLGAGAAAGASGGCAYRSSGGPEGGKASGEAPCSGTQGGDGAPGGGLVVLLVRQVMVSSGTSTILVAGGQGGVGGEGETYSTRYAGGGGGGGARGAEGGTIVLVASTFSGASLVADLRGGAGGNGGKGGDSVCSGDDPSVGGAGGTASSPQGKDGEAGKDACTNGGGGGGRYGGDGPPGVFYKSADLPTSGDDATVWTGLLPLTERYTCPPR